jgi:FkbM family methyltransferase
MHADIGTSDGLASDLIVKSGALRSPLVLVDIGCRNGINPRWQPIADWVDAYGFDAGVLEKSSHPRQHYFQLAVGDRDGEIGFYQDANPYQSRISPTDGYRVPMAKLDTLWAEGRLPPADFLKVDCEGFEPQILRGATKYLAASNLLGAEVETNFCIAPALHDTHFVEVLMPLLRERLVPADLALDRPSPAGPLTRPGNCNALFARMLPDERSSGQAYKYRAAEPSPSLDTILKSIIVLELHGLPHAAFFTLETFHTEIAKALDPIPIGNALKRAHVTRPDIAGPLYERFLPNLGFGILRGLRRAIKRRRIAMER